MNILRSVFCIGFLLSTMLHAQALHVSVGVEEQIPLGTLGAMQDALSVANAKQKTDLLIRLGVEEKLAKVAIKELYSKDEITLHPVRTGGQAHYAALFVPSSCCSYLFLLKGSDEDVEHQPWHRIDQKPLDAWHGPIALEFLSLRKEDTDEIVAHHVNLGHGSNICEDQTHIFSVLHDKLVQTMVTQDFYHTDTLGQQPVITIRHQSTFQCFPNRLYEESRAISIDYVLKKVERRYWRWSEAQQKFVASRFRAVVPPAF